MVGVDAGDEYALDLILSRPVKELGPPPEPDAVVVPRMLVADGHHVGADAGPVVAHVVAWRVGDDRHAPIAQSETGMAVPGYVHASISVTMPLTALIIPQTAMERKSPGRTRNGGTRKGLLPRGSNPLDVFWNDAAAVARLPGPLGLGHHDVGPVALAVGVVIGARLVDVAGVRHTVHRKGRAGAVLVGVVLVTVLTSAQR